MTKKFTGDIVLKWTDYDLLVNSEAEWREDVKQSFLSEYGIELTDYHFSNIQEVRHDN